jgi:hypothetical protein
MRFGNSDQPAHHLRLGAWPHMANPRRAVGHASAAMTLDIYADLLDDDM